MAKRAPNDSQSENQLETGEDTHSGTADTSGGAPADKAGAAETGEGELSPTVPEELTPEVRRTMRSSLVEGSVMQAFLNWTSGSVLIGYMLYLGATPTQLGMIASVPLLAQAMSPLAAWLAAILGRRRLLIAGNAVLARGLWVLAAALPTFNLPAGLEPTFMVLLVLVSSVFQAANSTLWAAWMGDVIPDKVRGRFFGLRTGIVGVVGTVANLGAGAFLDRVAQPIGFQVVLIVGVVCALISLALYFVHYDPPTPIERVSLAKVLRTPLADANFRRFLLFAVFWQFAVLLSSPFVFPYFLDEVGMSFTQVAVWSAIAATCSLVTSTLWGRLADSFGNKSVLAVGTFIAGALLPICWILTGITGNVIYVYVSAVFDAIAWGAIGPAIFNLALASAPRSQRASFFAMYALASGVAGFLGGTLSGPILELLQPLRDATLFGVQLSPYYGLFILSGIARSQAWRLLRRVKETNAWRTRDMLRQFRHGWRMSGFHWRA